MKRHLPDSTAGLDYALLTHFHPDHYGAVVASSPSSANGAYTLAGITQVGDAIRIRTLIDRGWPDYQYPAPLTDSTIANYRRFLEAQRTRGTTVERFKAGSPTQLRLRHDAAKFPTAKFRNIIGNGEAWTGTGDATHALFPPLASLAAADLPSENMCSLAFTFSYGPFRYYTGGDLPGAADPGFPAWHAVEPMIAGVVGRVDVHVVNQHGSMGEESEPFLRALSSSVFIVPSWAPSHPAPDVLKRIVNSRFAPAERFVYATDLRDAAKIVIGQRAGSLAAPPGHVIVRVERGGARYWVIVTSNADERDIVLSVRGPFASGVH
ncbi:MAG: hypothetical protein ABJF01_16640 [bacterium]